jgi:hypothetical protein
MRERGQTSVEWLAGMAAVVAIVGGVVTVTPGVASQTAGTARALICRVGGGWCQTQAASAATPPKPAPVPAPAPTPKGDYCGSSWFNAPELWFTSACEGHDRCYGAHLGKAACDTAFLNDMLAICEHVGSSSGGVSSSATRASCRAAAHLYYKAVVVGGGPSYCHRAVCPDDKPK